MVERFQEITGRSAIFVDLDGTLLKRNSLLIFMMFLLKLLAKRGRAGAVIKFLWNVGLRSMRIISHKNMKWHLTALAKRYLRHDDWNDLAGLMMRHVNSDVMGFLDSPQYAECAKYIATAAIEEYVLPLGRMLRFDGVLATRFAPDMSEYKETRGECKLKAIQSLLDSEGLSLECFLTDHRDDIPTAEEYPANTILVNPDSVSLGEFNNIGVTRVLNPIS